MLEEGCKASRDMQHRKRDVGGVEVKSIGRRL